MLTKTWVTHNNGLSEIARQHDLRIKRLEKRVFQKTIKYLGMPGVCDAPKCKKVPTFQCGKNFDGNIGSWCGDKHFNEFAV